MRPSPQKPLVLLFALLLANPGIPSLASGHEAQAEKQRLQSLLRELEQAAQERRQQHAREQELSHRLECNWALIRAYEACAQQHENNAEEHLKCSTAAKKNAVQCLEGGKQKGQE
ncbi:MAG TPA: hypothetical protein ENI97_08785 [Gammaproteobacteria bacterium]|nr:hypothetical protein [Gammaproteobacteria bacterium]